MKKLKEWKVDKKKDKVKENVAACNINACKHKYII